MLCGSNLMQYEGIVHAKLKILSLFTHYLQQTSLLFHGKLKEFCYREERRAQILLNLPFVFILYHCCHEHLKNKWKTVDMLWKPLQQNIIYANPKCFTDSKACVVNFDICKLPTAESHVSWGFDSTKYNGKDLSQILMETFTQQWHFLSSFTHFCWFYSSDTQNEMIASDW